MSSNFSKMAKSIREETEAIKNREKLNLTPDDLEALRKSFAFKEIEAQKKRFMAAHTREGLIYFNLLETLIKEGTIKPPKGMLIEDFYQAYQEAKIAIAEKGMAKSARKLRLKQLREDKEN